MRRAAAPFITAAILSACATPPSPEVVREANEFVFCENKEQCDLYWRRAQIWIAQHSDYRIQSVTDTVLSTHGPIRNDVRRAYQVVRIPLSGEREEFQITSGCGNPFGCSTEMHERHASFKRFLRDGR